MVLLAEPAGDFLQRDDRPKATGPLNDVRAAMDTSGTSPHGSVRHHDSGARHTPHIIYRHHPVTLGDGVLARAAALWPPWWVESPSCRARPRGSIVADDAAGVASRMGGLFGSAQAPPIAVAVIAYGGALGGLFIWRRFHSGGYVATRRPFAELVAGHVADPRVWVDEFLDVGDDGRHQLEQAALVAELVAYVPVGQGGGVQGASSPT